MSKNPNTKVPSFRIFDEQNKKVATLEHCFIVESRVNKEDYLALKSFTPKGTGVTYKPVWDDSIHLQIAELKGKEYLDVAISFQKHTYGNFAVIKQARGV